MKDAVVVLSWDIAASARDVGYWLRRSYFDPVSVAEADIDEAKRLAQRAWSCAETLELIIANVTPETERWIGEVAGLA